MKNRRLFARVICNLAVTLEHEGQPQTGMLHELGLGGASVMCRQPVSRAGLVTLVPEVEGDFEPVEYRVEWTQELGTRYRLGLSYPHRLSTFWNSWAASVLAGVDITNGEVLERRQTIRVPCQLAGIIERGNDAERGSILNIGIGGALISCRSRLAMNAEVRLSLSSPRRLERLEGRVLRSWNRRNSFLYGVEFTELSQEQSSELAILLDQLLS